MADDPIKGATDDGKADIHKAHSHHFPAASSSESQGDDDNDVQGHQNTDKLQMNTQAEKNRNADDVEGLRKRKI